MNRITDTMYITNTSGYRGVCYNRHKYRAYIYWQYKYINLGDYDTYEEAIKARDLGRERLEFILKYWRMLNDK